ncbi:MAG TPA: hypothetical protein VGU02_00870 [Gaiellaceae bacterium]|nr:hypothetical protein [Gaiellaceae bacterium]
MDRLTAERFARNQSTFRDANERIVKAAGEIGVDERAVPFICECAEEACTQVLLIDLAEYSAVRRHPRRFLHAAGHRDDVGTLIEMHGSYIVVEKTGVAGEIAEELA